MNYPMPISALDLDGVVRLLSNVTTMPGTADLQAARDKYRALTGKDAPKFDPSKAPQFWYSPTSLPNIPMAASAQYPPYSVKASGATLNGSTVNAFFLASTADAGAMFMELKTLFPDLDFGLRIESRDANNNPYTFAADEDRRIWDIVINGVPNHVGELLRQKSDTSQNTGTRGVGSPGHWTQPSPGIIRWQGDSETTSSIPPVPTPQRELHPDEMIVHNLVGEDQVVLKAVTTTPTGGVTDVETTLLQLARDTNAKVTAIAIAMGVQL